MDPLRYRVSVIVVSYQSDITGLVASLATVGGGLSQISLVIVDNSESGSDVSRLEKLLPQNLGAKVKSSGGNVGFARGCNFGALIAKKYFDAKYLFFVNPDIEFASSPFDVLCEALDRRSANAWGVQPKIIFSDSTVQHVALRRIPDFLDLVLLEVVTLRALFSKRYQRLNYHMEVRRNCEFVGHIPSGAFFGVYASEFLNMGGFDDRTFLYFEEPFLAENMRAAGKGVLYVPEVCVVHSAGTTTGNRPGAFKLSMHLHHCKSAYLYGSEVLHLSLATKAIHLTAMLVGIIERWSFCKALHLLSAVKKALGVRPRSS